MTKKVEEFLTEKKENLKELISNIKAKTTEFIEDNKNTAKRIAIGIGAAAIVTTSAMGLTSCDDLGGGLFQEFLEQHTETDIHTNMETKLPSTDTMVEDSEQSSEISTEAPTPTINFTYEECEKLFYEVFILKHPDLRFQEDYRLELVSLTRDLDPNFVSYTAVLTFTYTDKNETFKSFEDITFYNIPLSDNQFTMLKNEIPEEAIDGIAPNNDAFIAIIDKIPLETKTELCNHIANELIRQHPELLEDENTMEQ